MGRGDSAGVVIQLLVVITIVRHFLRALKPQLKLLQVNYFHSSVCLPTQVYFKGTLLLFSWISFFTIYDISCSGTLSLLNNCH